VDRWFACLLMTASITFGCASVPRVPFASHVEYGQNQEAADVISVQGTTLYFETYGAGKPLLLLHGNDQSIHSLRKQIDHFRKHRLVIAVDSRGHGRSPLGTDNLTYELMAEDVAALLRYLHMEQLDVIGWSDGGIIGLLLAIRHPESVRKLVIVGAALNPEGAHDWAFPPVQTMHSDALKKVAAGDSSDETLAQLQKAALLLNHPNIESQALAEITAPVLVVAGDEDVIRTEHTLEIYHALNKAHLYIVPGATHFAPLSHPALFNAAAERFLDNEFARPTTRAIVTGE
jgi:pimeloyl-ACP methyl ester carboxylesterase